MVDENTCVWLVMWRTLDGREESEYHLLEEAAQQSYRNTIEGGEAKVVLIAAVKNWWVK